MRYELNFDEDKIIDIESIGDNGVLDLKDCCKIMNEQQAIISALKEENEQLKEEIKAYPINEQYAEEIMQQNQKLHIERNDLRKENEQLKNELRKEKSLREYSDSMYGADLIVNIRFSKGEWKADVSVIDDE